VAVPLTSSYSSHRARVDAIVSIQLAIMRHTRTATLLLVCLSASTVSGKATPKEDATDVPPAQQFDDDILATFAPFESVKRVGNRLQRTKDAPKTDKPHMVFVMGPKCGACKKLKGQINAGTDVRGMFSHFSVIYDEHGEDWRMQPYDPQIYYFSPNGAPLGIKSNEKGFPFYYRTEAKVRDSMVRALKKCDEQMCKKKRVGKERRDCMRRRKDARNMSATDVKNIKEEVMALYKAHSSKTSKDVAGMLSRYVGREGELLALAKKKFKVEL